MIAEYKIRQAMLTKQLEQEEAHKGEGAIAVSDSIVLAVSSHSESSMRIPSEEINGFVHYNRT